MRLVLSALFLVLASLPSFAADPSVLDGEASFPEGPVVKDGKLYYA